MSKRDYYNVLGLKKSATEAEIKKAYRKESKKYHPDVNPDGEEQFKEIAEAYETLSDKNKKQGYDTYGHSGPQPQRQGGMNMDDIFSQFGFKDPFNRPTQRRGQDLILNIKISLEEVFNGTTKRFKYKRNIDCKPCNGVGGKSEKTCGVCQGHGYIMHQQQTNMGMMRQTVNCSNCKTTGKVVVDACTTCKGGGVVNKEELVDVNVPHGLNPNNSLEYIGLGHAIKGGPSGNLIVRVMVYNHKDFVRNGSDIRHIIKISYPEFVLGGKVQVPTIEGKDIKITIPKYSKVGDTLRIVNKGMKVRDSEKRGDMMVILDILIPTEVSDEESKLLEKLKNIDQGVETLKK